MAFDREMREESVDLRGSHLSGMAFFVVEDKAFGPIVVGILRADGVMAQAAGLPNTIQEFR